MAPKNKKKPPPRPWGRIIALLAGCGITLIGIVCGLEPDVIVLRALSGGAVMGLLTIPVVMGLEALMEAK